MTLLAYGRQRHTPSRTSGTLSHASSPNAGQVGTPAGMFGDFQLNTRISDSLHHRDRRKQSSFYRAMLRRHFP